MEGMGGGVPRSKSRRLAGTSPVPTWVLGNGGLPEFKRELALGVLGWLAGTSPVWDEFQGIMDVCLGVPGRSPVQSVPSCMQPIPVLGSILAPALVTAEIHMHLSHTFKRGPFWDACESMHVDIIMPLPSVPSKGPKLGAP